MTGNELIAKERTMARNLKRQAREAATARGHDLTNFQRYAACSYEAECRKCGKTVDVLVRPMPNETHIAGEAVALGCG